MKNLTILFLLILFSCSADDLVEEKECRCYQYRLGDRVFVKIADCDNLEAEIEEMKETYDFVDCY